MTAIRHILAIITIMACCTWASAAGQADTLLDKVVQFTTAKGSLEVEYTLEAGGQRASGTIVMDGRRFRVLSDLLDTWFDGTTQWSYSPATKEVSVTTPTDEELQQVNPFAIIDAFRRNYKASLKPLERNSKHHVIVMTPDKGASDITRVEVSVPVGQFYPARIVVWTSGGDILSINTKRIIRGNKVTDADFRYNPSIHPGAEIIDLR